MLHPRSWTHFPLAGAVADALGLRVIMDNDATAAALGERWRGIGDGAESFVYLYLGDGIGGGLVLDGQAYRGLRGNTGEISHIQVDPDGPACDCGGNGCLALYTTPTACSARPPGSRWRRRRGDPSRSRPRRSRGWSRTPTHASRPCSSAAASTLRAWSPGAAGSSTRS